MQTTYSPSQFRTALIKALVANRDISAELLPWQQQCETSFTENQPVGVRPSAVLVFFFTREEEIYLLLNKRSASISFPGAIAFPGGRLEAGESTEQAAIRETWEETQIDVREELMLGTLPAVERIAENARQFYWIRPHIAFSPTYEQGVPNREEVERLIELPLRHWLGRATSSIEFEVEPGEHIRGASAFILESLRQKLLPFLPTVH